MTSAKIKHRGLVTLLCLLGGTLSACVSLPPPKPAADNFIDQRFAPPPAQALIVLLPPTRQVGSEAAIQHLRNQLITQLTSAGYRATQLDETSHQTLWAQVIAEVGGLYDPQTGAAIPKARASAQSKLAQRICAEMKCAMVIQVELVKRQAKLSGTWAEWDGMRKPIDTIGANGRQYTFSGGAPSISVEARATMANGKLGFRTHGGVALPYLSDVKKVRSVLRTDLFEDDQDIASGVRIALAPLTPQPQPTQESR